MSFQRVPLDKFTDTFSNTIELSSAAIGGQVVSVSDEFFAEAFHLLLTDPAPSLKGQFGPKGALYSGWESRRHNPAHDWCIIRLGTTGIINGLDIDTSHFNGNEAPQVSVEVLHGSESEEPDVKDTRWSEILPKVNIGPSSRHLFKVTGTSGMNYVKLNMYPDGGIARFRVYGAVSPVLPLDASTIFDLAHVFAGGRVEFVSDQHFGVGTNLIYPGRGKNMGDGWETKRSRGEGHKDWVIIKLATLSILEQVEIDTAHFKGNFPESCDIRGCRNEVGRIDWNAYSGEDENWTIILPQTKLGPHRQHFFQLENVENKAFTHVKVTIYPDGGLQRIRVLGHRLSGGVAAVDTPTPTPTPAAPSLPETRPMSSKRVIPVLPLTPEAFAPFGQVIQAYSDHAAAPRGIKITPANGGSASKFHKISLLESSYVSSAGATPGISVYRCQPEGSVKNGCLELKVLERHPFTNQAFIPMGAGYGEGLKDPGQQYLVVVAHNGLNGRPNINTVRAFIASAAQGIVYNTAIWHQPMTVLGEAMDFACVETQIGDGSTSDCEIVEMDDVEDMLLLRLPAKA
ncbi:allantoicase [Collybia nuda]|uniref:Allantoicase n=1 Tax=Collybia nuda TaxID=64659 RepID=A0A9P6CKU0_9AGAR|nr:allantoicase [Collybia nuda]